MNIPAEISLSVVEPDRAYDGLIRLQLEAWELDLEFRVQLRFDENEALSGSIDRNGRVLVTFAGWVMEEVVSRIDGLPELEKLLMVAVLRAFDRLVDSPEGNILPELRRGATLHLQTPEVRQAFLRLCLAAE